MTRGAAGPPNSRRSTPSEGKSYTRRGESEGGGTAAPRQSSVHRLAMTQLAFKKQGHRRTARHTTLEASNLVEQGSKASPDSRPSRHSSTHAQRQPAAQNNNLHKIYRTRSTHGLCMYVDVHARDGARARAAHSQQTFAQRTNLRTASKSSCRQQILAQPDPFITERWSVGGPSERCRRRFPSHHI